MTRWRNRIGEEGVEWLLTKTIEAGKRSGAVKGSDLKRVTVDTTVMEKNIAHPTGARLFEAARRKLVGLAREAGLGLRQSYYRLTPLWSVRSGATPMPAKSGPRLQRHLRVPIPGQGRDGNATCGCQIPVKAAAATPPAAAKSRSGRRLQRHLRRPNPGQGGGYNATCGCQIPVRAATATPPAAAESQSGRQLQRHLRRSNPSQGGNCNATCGGRIPVRAATAMPPAAAKSRSGPRLQRHLRLPNPGQGGNCNATCGCQIPVRAATATPPAAAKSRLYIL